MRLFGKIILVCLVWLTAAMTLVAGFPRFVCRCPDGHVKEVCFSLPSTSGCCCGDTCCSRLGGRCCCQNHAGRTTGQTRKAYCCGRHDPSPTTRGPATPSWQAAGCGCVKTLAQPTDLVADGHKAAAGEFQATLKTFPPSEASQAPSLLSEAPGRVNWQGHALNPPPDLVTLLQRLLI